MLSTQEVHAEFVLFDAKHAVALLLLLLEHANSASAVDTSAPGINHAAFVILASLSMTLWTKARESHAKVDADNGPMGLAARESERGASPNDRCRERKCVSKRSLTDTGDVERKL